MFTRKALEAAGFVGWVPFAELAASDCPSRPGVYVVVHGEGAQPRFAERSCGGWYRGDPTVSAAVLAENWVDGAEVAYIGKATKLRARLRTYAAFGRGVRAAHWGGRLIWQLASVEGLRVAWKETPTTPPEQVEAEMIGLFRARYGKAPFANEPNRLGR